MNLILFILACLFLLWFIALWFKAEDKGGNVELKFNNH